MLQFIVQQKNENEIEAFTDFWIKQFNLVGINPRFFRNNHWAEDDGINYRQLNLPNDDSNEGKYCKELFIEKVNGLGIFLKGESRI